VGGGRGSTALSLLMTAGRRLLTSSSRRATDRHQGKWDSLCKNKGCGPCSLSTAVCSAFRRMELAKDWQRQENFLLWFLRRGPHSMLRAEICRTAHARARSHATLSEVGLAWFDPVRWWELWEADRFIGFQHGSLSRDVSKAFRGAGNRSRNEGKAAPLRKRSRELH
jgi:hypothetical protein